MQESLFLNDCLERIAYRPAGVRRASGFYLTKNLARFVYHDTAFGAIEDNEGSAFLSFALDQDGGENVAVVWNAHLLAPYS
jgi:hypothetical protein